MNAPSLFQRTLQVAVLASGSKGNCTYVGDGHAGVLIDCGISTRQVLQRMAQIGLGDAPIDAVLITHEHSDHVGAARILAKRLLKDRGTPVPFFMTAGTAEGLHDNCAPDGIELIVPGQAFKIRHLEVDPFTVPHDTLDPVAWRVCSGGTWVGVITDLGRPTALVEEKLRELSLAVIEFNHDADLLMTGSYPWSLKQRIRSNHGHLSNEQAGRMLTRAAGGSLRAVVLAHLSGENNRPERALARAQRALTEAGCADRVGVHLGWQDKPNAPLDVAVTDW